MSRGEERREETTMLEYMLSGVMTEGWSLNNMSQLSLVASRST